MVRQYIGLYKRIESALGESVISWAAMSNVLCFENKNKRVGHSLWIQKEGVKIGSMVSPSREFNIILYNSEPKQNVRVSRVLYILPIISL